MSGHANRNIASRGRPVSSPTFSYASEGPPCAVMTEFIVSTTRCTLSVSVPSRSQRTARRALAAATARRTGGDGLADGQSDLLGDAAIPRLLSDTDQGGELVVERVDVLDAGVHDLEAEIRERVALGKALEHHLADPSRRDLGDAALPDARLELVDEPIDLVGGQPLGGGLADRARELAAVELLPAAVALQDLDAGGLAPLKGGEALLAPVADAAPADRIAVLRLARIDDAGVEVAAAWALHRHKIWDRVPPNLVVNLGRLTTHL